MRDSHPLLGPSGRSPDGLRAHDLTCERGLPYEYSPAEIRLFNALPGAMTVAQSESVPPALLYATVLPVTVVRLGIRDWRYDATRAALLALGRSDPLRMTAEFDALIEQPSRRLRGAK